MRLRRRDLARGAAGLCCSALALARPAAAQRGGDGRLLEHAIGLEQRLALLYEAESFADAELFGDHSREHARGLELALRNRGGRAPKAGRPSPGGVRGALRLETEAVAAYHSAIGQLRDGRLLPTFAAIMANHGQHLVVLRAALHRDPIPGAFETGDVQ